MSKQRKVKRYRRKKSNGPVIILTVLLLILIAAFLVRGCTNDRPVDGEISSSSEISSEVSSEESSDKAPDEASSQPSEESSSSEEPEQSSSQKSEEASEQPEQSSSQQSEEASEQPQQSSSQQSEEVPEQPQESSNQQSEEVPEQPEESSSQQSEQSMAPAKPLDKSTEPGDTKDSWNLILVNPWNKLPENFEVKLTALKNGMFVDERAYPELQQMMDDCRAAGLNPLICSSYRDVKKQIRLFNNQIAQWKAAGYSQKDAEIEAAKWVAVPGTSEHHTGLALDIVAASFQQLTKQQENTAEQKWLMENCWKYGFILRFPEDKQDITGITYEPWHYRYVGKKHAEIIHREGICLEEYLETID